MTYLHARLTFDTSIDQWIITADQDGTEISTKADDIESAVLGLAAIANANNPDEYQIVFGSKH